MLGALIWFSGQFCFRRGVLLEPYLLSPKDQQYIDSGILLRDEGLRANLSSGSLLQYLVDGVCCDIVYVSQAVEEVLWPRPDFSFRLRSAVGTCRTEAFCFSMTSPSC